MKLFLMLSVTTLKTVGTFEVISEDCYAEETSEH
jgi:hypothetical protein